MPQRPALAESTVAPTAWLAERARTEHFLPPTGRIQAAAFTPCDSNGRDQDGAMKASKRRSKGPASGSSRWVRQTSRDRERKETHTHILVLLAFGLFVVGSVGGYAWAMDRQARGGILRQYQEARQRPDWVRLDALPSYVPRTFLLGADPAVTGRASLAGDTREAALSSDLVRQIHLLEPNLRGTAEEMVLTPVLESRLSRRALLELYLNRIQFGRQGTWDIFGLHAAAREYFDKEPAQMTLSETATLAGLLLPPRIQDPERRPGAVGVRRNEVLRLLFRAGDIDGAAYRAAIAEPLAFQPGIEFAPMTRPLDWAREQEPIRLPANLRANPDTLAADSAGLP